MAQPVYLSLVILGAVVGMAVAMVAWLSRDRAGARPLTILLVVASLWALAEALSIAAAASGSIRFWALVGLSLSAIAPPAWLALVLEYTGNGDWLRPRNLSLLAVEPLAFLGLVWTNADHGLVWTGFRSVLVGDAITIVFDFGAAFWAHQLYSLVLLTTGGTLLVWLLLKTEGPFRTQSTALLFALNLPALAIAFSLFDIAPQGVDLTPVGYVLSGLIVVAAMFRRQLLDLTPVARELGREAALDDLDDRVLIVDDDDRVVDANPAAERLLADEEESIVGRDLESVSSDLFAAVDDGDETAFQFERDGRVRYYDIRISSLYGGYGVLSGRLISLRDVTERRQREQRLDVLNRLLRHNLRNELNVVRSNVELARQHADGDTDEWLANAVTAIDGIVERSDKVGTLSRTLRSDHEGSVDLGRQLAADRTIDRDPVTVEVPEGLVVAGGPSLSVVFQELVSNALEHNDGDPEVRVAVDEERSDDDLVVVAVRDNGPGIDEQERRAIVEGRETQLRHTSGIGLWLANWTVERHGGRLTFENRPDGCTALVFLPRASRED